MTNETSAELPRIPVFATTRWSVILNAGDSQTPEHQDALAQLCRSYWFPAYAFARRQGWSQEDAKDLTQDFFAHVLESGFLGKADRS